MGIADEKIGKSQLGFFAKKTISKGNFSKFARDFSNDISKNGLEELSNSIISHVQSNDEQTR